MTAVKAQNGSPMATTELLLERDPSRTDTGAIRSSSGRRLGGIAFLSLALCSLANYALALWLGLPLSAPWSRGTGIYRRIGPEGGAQVFTAGSSLLIQGVSWPEVSESLGAGIENWSVGGSSPEVWEVFQQRQTDPALTIVGVSMYDLNEMRLTPERANYVPLVETIRDLWASGTGPDLSRRILMQYVMKDVRFLFPAAGWTDKVLVGLRSKVADALGFQATLENHEGVVVERDRVLDAGENTMKLSDWSAGRALRRLALLREENHGVHEFFHGPKRMALERILLRARQRGPVVVVVLPVSRSYAQEFLNKSKLDEFERALNEEMKTAPEAMLMRLDRVPGITDDGYFTDQVHLNAYGRRVTTPVFLKDIAEVAAKQNLQALGTLPGH
jgi:hypothetical protein